jgi:hypothetical protein
MTEEEVIYIEESHHHKKTRAQDDWRGIAGCNIVSNMETVPFEETWMLLVAQIAALHFDETQL